ncbi:translocation/assembly module TamB domain-containing protein [Azospirillum halopraeferens]|uniref:translocation/assembly module TamB domain-containing protein n=1 Tax=Azospirillum halopraeferens TaxID=34010 RepID=UPI00041780E7|nr:translocation/assembly module TamB domain-containing protein [Azospirillum halopraeferens]
MRRVLPAAAGLVLLAAAALAQDDAGGRSGVRGWIASTIERLVSGPDLQVRIGEISGFVPLNFRVSEITVADREGVWMRLDDLHLNLAPTALFSGRLGANALEAARVSVDRAPVGSADPAPPPEEPVGPVSLLPDLPIGVAIDRLAVQELRLGADLAGGEPVALRVAGEDIVLSSRGAALSARLEVERLGDRPGQATLAAAFRPQDETLDIALQASEPAGGVIARTLGLPGLPPVEIRVDGGGPLSDWGGTLVAAAGDLLVNADAGIRAAEGGHLVTVTAGGALAPLVEAYAGSAAVPLVGDEPVLRAEVLIAPDGGLTLRPLTLDVAAGSARVSGTVAAGFDRVDVDYRLEVAPGSPLLAAAPGLAGADAVVTGTAAGPLDALAATLAARATGIATGDPALDPLLGDAVEVAAAATVDTGRGLIALDRATVSAAAGTVTARGTVGNWGETVDAVLALALPDLARLSDLAGQPLAGAADLEGPVAVAADGAVRADLSGTVRGLVTGTPADPLLGDTAQLAVTAAVGTDGVMRVERLAVDGAHAALTGRAELAGDRLDAAARITLPRLAVVGDAVGTPMQGAATVDAVVAGPLDALDTRATIDARNLVVAERPLGNTTLTATAAGLPERPSGRLEARAQLSGVGLRLDTAYALDGSTLRLSDLALAGGRNRVTGAVAVSLDTLTADGRLEGALPDLQALSELAGVPLRGDASFTLALDATGGDQAATVEARAANLRVAPEGDEVLTARRLTLSGRVEQALSAPSGQLRLRLDDGALAGTPVTRLTAEADGTAARATFRANATAPGPQGLNAELAGAVDATGPITLVRLDRLRGSLHGESFRLTQPARLEAGPDHYVIAGLRLASGEARLIADASLTSGRLGGAVRLERVPLALARLAAPDLPLEGTLNAGADLGGTIAAPQLDADVRVADLRAQQIAQAGIRGLDATLQARWRDNRLGFTGTVVPQGREGQLAVRGSLPLVMDPQTMVPALPPDGRLEAAATGSVRLVQFNDLLAASGDRMAGRLDLNVTAGGTLGQPVLGGTITLADGRYENRASGAVLTNVAARIVGSGDVFRVERLDGRTPGGGRFRVTGAVAPGAEQPLDLRISLDNAALLQTDLVTAALDANLTLTGTFEQARLAGPVRVVRAEVRIPGSSPPEVVELEVIEIGRGRTPPAAATEAEAAGGGTTIVLDMAVTARNTIFVRGRGLDAQFSGDLAVGGTTARPAVNGRLTMVRGELDVLGRSFDFRRGIISFDGNWPVDPRLDLVAAATANEVTAQIEVTGTAGRPRIGLTSPQGLPQDEVLSRVLFGKPLSRLSAFEAIQMARSAADLAGVGGGAGFVDQLREGLGIDRLEFVQGTDGGPGAVEAGRYVSDRVYVGVEQGLGDTGSGARVEVDITDTIKAEARVGADANTRFGVTFEWDY